MHIIYFGDTNFDFDLWGRFINSTSHCQMSIGARTRDVYRFSMLNHLLSQSRWKSGKISVFGNWIKVQNFVFETPEVTLLREKTPFEVLSVKIGAAQYPRSIGSNNFAYMEANPRNRIVTNFCTGVDVYCRCLLYRITHGYFGDHRFRHFGIVTCRISGFSADFRRQLRQCASLP